MTMLYQVTVPHFCCGIEVVDSKVSAAAPIMRWAIGKRIAEVARWVEGKGGKITLCVREARGNG